MSQPDPMNANKGKGESVLEGRFRKVKKIGSGGIGTVYLAHQLTLARPVALKELRELFFFFPGVQRLEMIKRFEEVIKKSSRLSHPNIAVILDANVSQEYPYVISEFVGGGNLKTVLTAQQKVSPQDAIKVFLQILLALKHAHDQGVFHRGLKPENILFDSSGNVRLSDFGFSSIIGSTKISEGNVYIGAGPIGYLAPESLRGIENTTQQTDLYAAGILLYEMLSGRLPGRRSPMPTQLCPELPPRIDHIFDKLTLDDVNDRYQNVDEVLDDFYQSELMGLLEKHRGGMLFIQSPFEVPGDPTDGWSDALEEEDPFAAPAVEEPPPSLPAGGLQAESSERLSRKSGLKYSRLVSLKPR